MGADEGALSAQLLSCGGIQAVPARGAPALGVVVPPHSDDGVGHDRDKRTSRLIVQAEDTVEVRPQSQRIPLIQTDGVQGELAGLH